MTPSEIAASTAAALWNDRARLVVVVHHDEDAILRGMHARRQPPVTITLPGGACVRKGGSMNPDKLGEVKVDAGTHTEEFVHGYESTPIRKAWAAVQCEALLDILGAECRIPEIRTTIRQRMLRMIGSGPRRPGPDLEALPRMLAEEIGRSILAREPVQCEDTYIIDIVKEGRRTEVKRSRSQWLSIGSDVMILQDRRYTRDWEDCDTHMVSHPRWGAVRVPSGAILQAFGERRSKAFRNVLPERTALEHPQARICGNARFEAIRRLCSRALLEDPHLSDASGTPLEPLITELLPRMLDNHEKASRNVGPAEAAGLDEDLLRSFEIVRAAFHEGLSRSSSKHRDAFMTDLRFLEIRHPLLAQKVEACPSLP